MFKSAWKNNGDNKLNEISKVFWSVLRSLVPLLYFHCAGTHCSWLCFGAREVVKNESSVCVLGLWGLAFPMDKGCQTELRAELPSSVRTETIWAGEVTVFRMPEMQGKSPLWHNSICFCLFLPFIFHRALVTVCCSCCLALPLGFLGTGDAPPSVFGDAPLPLAGSMACHWGWEPAAPPGTGIPSFPPESSFVASAFWCAWGEEITPKPTELCGLLLLCLLHDSGPAQCSSTCISGFPPSSSVSWVTCGSCGFLTFQYHCFRVLYRFHWNLWSALHWWRRFPLTAVGVSRAFE